MSLIDLFREVDLCVNSNQSNQFEQFYRLLIEENEKYNLTAITEMQDVYIKHFLDSSLVFKCDLDLSKARVIDIGTGAGFPAIPIKIMEPGIQMTCLDSLNKRIGFIQKVLQELDISNVELIHGRAEDFGQDLKYREQFDIAVSRAVAELRLLLELVMPFVKVGGYFIAYKSLKSEQEVLDSEHALKVLGCKIMEIKTFVLPGDSGTRDIIIVRKVAKTPVKYPRKPGIPKKSPL